MTDALQEKNYIDKVYFEDIKEFFAKFIFNPTGEHDHISKDLLTTNLRSRYKEPELARAILQALHILANPKYFHKITETMLIGYKENNIDREGVVIGIVNTPVYEKRDNFISKFPKTFRFLKDKFLSLVWTSSARDGFLMKSFNTRTLQREDTLEDKTAVKPQFPFFPQQKKSSGGGVQYG